MHVDTFSATSAIFDENLRKYIIDELNFQVKNINSQSICQRLGHDRYTDRICKFRTFANLKTVFFTTKKLYKNWTLEFGLWTLDCDFWTLAKHKRTLDYGLWTLRKNVKGLRTLDFRAEDWTEDFGLFYQNPKWTDFVPF